MSEDNVIKLPVANKPDTDGLAPVRCGYCADTGRVWVDYGQCEDLSCEAHRGFEDCPDCNVRQIK